MVRAVHPSSCCAALTHEPGAAAPSCPRTLEVGSGVIHPALQLSGRAGGAQRRTCKKSRCALLNNQGRAFRDCVVDTLRPALGRAAARLPLAQTLPVTGGRCFIKVPDGRFREGLPYPLSRRWSDRTVTCPALAPGRWQLAQAIWGTGQAAEVSAWEGTLGLLGAGGKASTSGVIRMCDSLLGILRRSWTSRPGDARPSSCPSHSMPLCTFLTLPDGGACQAECPGRWSGRLPREPAKLKGHPG